LDEVGVEIARIHRPEPDLHAVRSTLDSWAEAIAAALPPAAGGMQYLVDSAPLSVRDRRSPG
jgi:hypothetical protein